MVKDGGYMGPTLSRLCGQPGKPNEIVSMTDTLWVSFVSDGMIGKTGFKASWIHD